MSDEYVGDYVNHRGESESLFACSVCGALLVHYTQEHHRSWHAAQSLTDVTEVRTETERDPGPCPSMSPSGQDPCQFDEGHKTRHLHRAKSGCRERVIRWSDEEASRG